MRKALASILLSLMLFATPCLAQKPKDTGIAVGPNAPLIEKTYRSVVLLFQEDESGGMHMLCTATAYKQVPNKPDVDAKFETYRMVSASHCVIGKTEADQKANKYYVTTDSTGAKNFLPARLIESGDESVGDDFSIFEVETKEPFTITPLGSSSELKINSPVINVASPMGLGKQFFIGYVSDLKVDRPPLDAGVVKWDDALLIMIGSGPGSSGSSIVSVDSGNIVAFLVGGTGAEIGAICVPVDKFKKFEALVDAGKYKKHKASDNLASDADRE